MTFISQSKTFPPIINPQRISSVDPGGVQQEIGLTGRGPVRVGKIRQNQRLSLRWGVVMIMVLGQAHEPWR